MTVTMSTTVPYSTAPPAANPAMSVTAASESPAGRTSLAQSHKDDQNRRSACDRCRRQKLRCERRTSATLQDACKRCLKSRSKCVTGPSLPMGRPRIRTRSTSPFDYRSAKRDSIPNMADFLPAGLAPLPTARSSPAAIPTSDGPRMSDGSIPHGMLPPTTLPMLDMGPQTKLMPEPIYTNVHEMYPPKHPMMSAPPSASREDHMRHLYDLCAQALVQCQTVASTQSRNAWSMGAQSIDSIVAGMTNPVEHGSLSFGELLETSNDFIRLTQALLFAPAHKSPLSSRNSSVDFSNHHYTANALHQLRSASAVSTYSPAGSPAFDDKDANFSPSSMPSLSSSVATSLSPGIAERMDFPTTLALYTCYTTILRIYRHLLGRVHFAILTQPMPWSALDAIVPGIYPDGVQAEQRPDLHVKVFAQVCRDMLEQMEKYVTLSTKFYHGGAEPELLRALVETLVKAEASEGAARIVSPKALVDEILRTVDGSLGV